MKRTILILLLLLAFLPAVRAQEPDTATGAESGSGSDAALSAVINDIIASYSPWISAEFSGKVKADGLPVSPTIKMYMVRDSLIQVSARVPLLGEVGRLSLSKDRLLIVNKMKKTYCEESPDNLFEMYPTILLDLQSLLLARVVILGDGELSDTNRGVVEVQSADDGSWLVVPQVDPGAVPFTYGYQVGANGRTEALVAELAIEGSLEVLYSYRDRGEQLAVTIQGKKKTEINIDFSTVRWGGTEMSPIRTDSYRRLSLKDFISSLRM